MAKTKIPIEIQEKAVKIIEAFNLKVYRKSPGVSYYAIFKSDFLYLNRIEGKRDGPVARLKFNGKIDNWDFAIFKWSSEQYDPEEFSFPGFQHVNGSIEGALKAGNIAYPPSWSPLDMDLLDFFSILGNKGRNQK